MIIISVEESPLLIAVDSVVGGVEVKDQVVWRFLMRVDELIDQNFGDLDQGLAIDAILQAAKCGRRGKLHIGIRPSPGGELEHGIMA
jgi:hypothetical protein